MKKNLLLYIIIIIAILLIILTIILFSLLQKNNNNIQAENYNLYEESSLGVNKVIDRNEYCAIKMILDNYFNVINYINADIQDIDLRDLESRDISSENKRKEILEEYTIKSAEIIENLLDKECIEYLSLNQDKIIKEFQQYKSKDYIIENMYYINKNINTTLYYIDGMLDNNKGFKLIVKTDSYTETFSIYSQGYIESKNIDETNLEEKFSIQSVEYIEQNDNNTLIMNDITDKYMAQYYLENYGNMILNDLEKSYEMLDDNYKQKKFPTYDSYKNYIKSSNIKYNLLELQSYYFKEFDEYNEFSCKDQYNNVYIFKETSVMEYTVQLDDYTLENEEFNSKYKEASNRDKGILNIDKFFRMINMQDYTSAYNVLDEKFKANNFKTQAEFESYIKTKLFRYNKIEYQEYGNEISSLHTYKLQLTDATSENAQTVEFNVVMKLLEGTNFVMSFSIK